uniref:C2H2-type domain-containing protein n=1 Tax=Macrostomum lignano TaxID=282301 RepID=A0A1I8IZ79_9PLAT
MSRAGGRGAGGPAGLARNFPQLRILTTAPFYLPISEAVSSSQVSQPPVTFRTADPGSFKPQFRFPPQYKFGIRHATKPEPQQAAGDARGQVYPCPSCCCCLGHHISRAPSSSFPTPIFPSLLSSQPGQISYSGPSASLCPAFVDLFLSIREAAACVAHNFCEENWSPGVGQRPVPSAGLLNHCSTPGAPRPYRPAPALGSRTHISLCMLSPLAAVPTSSDSQSEEAADEEESMKLLQSQQQRSRQSLSCSNCDRSFSSQRNLDRHRLSCQLHQQHRHQHGWSRPGSAPSAARPTSPRRPSPCTCRSHNQPCLCKFCGKRFSRPWLLPGLRHLTSQPTPSIPTLAPTARSPAHAHPVNGRSGCHLCGKSFRRQVQPAGSRADALQGQAVPVRPLRQALRSERATWSKNTADSSCMRRSGSSRHSGMTAAFSTSATLRCGCCGSGCCCCCCCYRCVPLHSMYLPVPQAALQGGLLGLPLLLTGAPEFFNDKSNNIDASSLERRARGACSFNSGSHLAFKDSSGLRLGDCEAQQKDVRRPDRLRGGSAREMVQAGSVAQSHPAP